MKFIVVNDDSGVAPLLGSKACQRMNIITINTNNLKQVATVASTSMLDSFGDVFGDELGTLPGVAHFEIDSCVTPVVAATRRVPVALREPLKIELNKLQTMNVIAQVEEPTDWVSNVVVARKKNGDLRICIDPHTLNNALGCYACTPTIKVPDNREVRDNKRRDFRCSKSAMHEPDVGPGERSLRLPARSR